MAVFSTDANLLFIHVPKCGGHWAKHYLKKHVPGMNFPEDLDYPFPIGHIPLRDVEMFSGHPLESWKKIVAVIRNPYEQQVSQYKFWLGRYQKGQRHEHDVYTYEATQKAKEKGVPPLEEWLSRPDAFFHVWYRERVAGKVKTTAKRAGYSEFGGYYHYWLAVDGEIPDTVDIVRFENLNTEFPEAVAEFAGGVHDPGEPKNVGPKKKKDIRSYYSPVALDIVERNFEWTFSEGLYERWSKPAWNVTAGAVR